MLLFLFTFKSIVAKCVPPLIINCFRVFGVVHGLRARVCVQFVHCFNGSSESIICINNCRFMEIEL